MFLWVVLARLLYKVSNDWQLGPTFQMRMPREEERIFYRYAPYIGRTLVSVHVLLSHYTNAGKYV